MLYESDAIVDYLEEEFASPSLWPHGTPQRARARRIAIEASAYLYPPVRSLVTSWGSNSEANPEKSFEVEARPFNEKW